MFLISLLIFPFIAYYIFSKYRNDINELNGAIKLIGIIGLFIVVVLGGSKIFDNKDTYLVIIIMWYIIVFFYHYSLSINLQIKNLDKFKYGEISYTDGIIKGIFLFLIFVLYISIIDNYDINEKLGIFRYDSNGLLSTVSMFLVQIILFGIIFEFIDMVKNSVFRKIINQHIYRERLKQELKIEILNELKLIK
ncbi:MAG: hypothetical protein WC850_00140 [Candidatus Gracilibacteria bacterium]